MSPRPLEQESLPTRIARAIIPRRMRDLLRAPGPAVRAWSAGLRFRWFGAVPFIAADDWRGRCHPGSASAFECHHTSPDYRAELEAFRAECRPGMRLIDVGAHWGVFCLAACHYGGSNARVLALEPSDDARPLLEANLKLAGLGPDRVRVLPVAAGKSGEAITVVPAGAGGSHMLVRARDAHPDAVGIPTTTIDALAVEFPPTHIKIDVEGHEASVLAGAERTLRDLKPVLFLELHVDYLRKIGDDPSEVVRFLQARGYRPSVDPEAILTQWVARAIWYPPEPRA